MAHFLVFANSFQHCWCSKTQFILVEWIALSQRRLEIDNRIDDEWKNTTSDDDQECGLKLNVFNCSHTLAGGSLENDIIAGGFHLSKVFIVSLQWSPRDVVYGSDLSREWMTRRGARNKQFTIDLTQEWENALFFLPIDITSNDRENGQK